MAFLKKAGFAVYVRICFERFFTSVDPVLNERLSCIVSKANVRINAVRVGKWHSKLLI